MTDKGQATIAMFNAIAKDTKRRARRWFKEHKDCVVAYWGKDDFLPYQSDYSAKREFMERHPEIEDLDDHTLLRFDNDTLVLWHFCPRIKNGIKDFYSEGVNKGNDWLVLDDLVNMGNYIVYV